MIDRALDVSCDYNQVFKGPERSHMQAWNCR